MKHIYTLAIAVALIFSSCSDFLNTSPGGSTTPENFWKTESDAKLALVGCYREFESTTVIYRDCGSDNAYNHHRHEGWTVIGNGGMSSVDPGSGQYNYKAINRCNDFMENIDKVPFKDASLKEVYKAEVRFIRAYKYFWLIHYYGDVPLSLKTYETVEEARIPRNSKAEVVKFVLDELADVAEILPTVQSEKGRITKGAAYALAMRLNLYEGSFQQALSLGKKVQDLGVYSISLKYDQLFMMANKGNSECIFDVQYVENDRSTGIIGSMLPNGDGGWSSIVPLKSLVDAYEMKSGLTIEEAKSLGQYSDQQPFVNRDPRLKHTIIYPGQDWNGRIFNPFPVTFKVIGDDGKEKEIKNPDHPNSANNSSKTGLSVKKFASPLSQYSDVWNTGMSLMACRYAEVLLTMAEAKIELNQIDGDLYSYINEVRNRAEMPDVDQAKYSNQTKLRELIRRERRVEFAMEGLRRADIIRWGIAKDVMNGPAQGTRLGSVDYNEPDEDKRAKLDGEIIFVEDRKYEDHNKYLPISQNELDLNDKLTQTEGYK